VIQSVKNYYKNNPLYFILFVGLLLRLIAAFFSKGYAFHDDHFCVIRVAQNWALGLPHWLEMGEPPKHSMLYAAVNAVFLWLLEIIGINDPIHKTTFIRVIHAFYSLLTIYFAYKIVAIISNAKYAILVAWVLALIWFMPYLSVKFLAELVCVPIILAGFYQILLANQTQKKVLLKYALAGCLFGLAFSIRLHTILFAGGLGLVLLFRKQWYESILFTLGYLIAAFLIIGATDQILFEYPFHSIVNYFEHNSENANNYIQGSLFKFTFTTLGFLVPPISLMLIFGYLRSFKLEPMMFVAAAVFFIFHSVFPNQQERFILPVLPLFIILGVIGWQNFKANSTFWMKRKSLLNGFWKFFWVVNIIVSLALALTFSKKDRVAPLHYLANKTDVASVVIENERSVKQVPAYYLGTNSADYGQFDTNILGLKQFKQNKEYLDPDYKLIFTLDANGSIDVLKAQMKSVEKVPNYIVFQGDNELEKRKARVKTLFPKSTFELIETIEPSNFDKLLHFFNPRIHRNQTAYIYKII